MELAQKPELKQRMTLSPQVYQGLSILAMPVMELQNLIEAEVLENPVLETDEVDTDPQDAESSPSESAQTDQERAWEDWLDMYEDLHPFNATTAADSDTEADGVGEYSPVTQTFAEYLMSQLGPLDVSDDVYRAAAAVVGLLDDDGYFKGELVEVAAIAAVDIPTAAEGVSAVQSLDPPGVGARTLAEALSIQLAHLGIEDPLLDLLIRDHLQDIASNQFARIARVAGVEESEIRQAVSVLRQLNPRPAGEFSAGPAPGYLVPDVTVRRFDDTWMVFPNNEFIPSLRVSSRYRNMLRSGSQVDDETKRYLKDKIRSAEAFIRNVDRRKDTISRIAEKVLEAQQDYFENGTGPLRPLRLEDVAVELGVHLSTVSRGVTGKYMMTPYGLFEIKHFFSGGYRTRTGMDVASTSIKHRIRDLIASEDPAKPYSDQKLVETLNLEGVTVARRTVAKYREELGIEPSWARRRR